MLVNKETVNLAVKLTTDEQVERGRSLAKAHEDIDAEAVHQDIQKRQMKSRMAELEAKRNELAVIVARGAELRPVECEDRGDMDRGKVTRFRMDTGEQVWERVMTDAERQLGLPLQ